MLRIRAGIDVEHWDDSVGAHDAPDPDGHYLCDAVMYPPNPTLDDKLKCEFLAVLRCAGAIFDERGKAQ